MKTTLKPLFLSIPLALIASPVMAATIAEYTFDSGSPASTDLDTDSVAADFIAAGAGFNFSGSTGTAYVFGNNTPGDAATAVTNDAYFSFSVTPNSSFSLDSLDFDMYGNSTNENISGSAELTFFIRSSVDNYASTISGATFTQAYDNTTAALPVSRNVDLSGASFQGLTDEVTFRIYIYDTSNSTDRVARVDNVYLTTVPEPGAFALIAGSLAMLSIMIRRRQ